MWTVLKVFTESVTILLLFYVSVVWPQSLWDVSPATKDWIQASCVGKQSPNHWTAREVTRAICSSKRVVSCRHTRLHEFSHCASTLPASRWPPASLKSSRYLTPPKPRLQKWFLWLQSLLLLYILKRRSSKYLPVREPLWSPAETVSNGLVIHQMKETTEVQIIGIKWERRTSEDQL